MKDLARLVKALKPKEIHLIRSIYKGQSRENTCLKLFNSLLLNKVMNNKDAYTLIGPHKHISIISQVKKRLESDILNLILISSITNGKEQYDKSELTCQKNLLLGRLLFERGLTNEALRLLQSTSKEAEKAELHDIKASCDDFLRSTYIQTDIENLGEQYQENASYSIENLFGVQHARSINFPFLYAKSFSEPIKSFNINLEELNIHIRESSSLKAIYWYQLAVIHYYIHAQDYQNAKKYSTQLLYKSLMNNDLFSAFEKNDFYLQLSRILLYLREPADALRAAGSCIRDLPRGLTELSMPYQILLRCYLIMNELESAAGIADRALKNAQLQSGVRTGIWYLYKAAVFFSQKNYKEAIHLLISKEQHFSESISLKTFAMLLELLSIFDQGDRFWFDYKLESFRKRIERLNIKEIDRVKYLYRMLKNLKDRTADIHAKSLKDVAIGSYLFTPAWDPLGYEVIDMEVWMLVRVKK